MRIQLLLIPVLLALSGCATAAVTGAVVGTAATATKYAVKGTVAVASGAGKLAYHGTSAAINSTRQVVRDKPVDPSIADDYAALPDPE